jgi:hypothetical protein
MKRASVIAVVLAVSGCGDSDKVATSQESPTRVSIRHAPGYGSAQRDCGSAQSKTLASDLLVSSSARQSFASAYARAHAPLALRKAVYEGCLAGLSDPAHVVAIALSAWSEVARSYNAVLQQCARQPNPVPGYMRACVGKYAGQYDQAFRNLRSEIAVGDASSTPACHETLAAAKTASADVTTALRRALRASNAFYSKIQTYRGPPVITVLNRANRVTQRDSREVDTSELLRRCRGTS